MTFKSIKLLKLLKEAQVCEDNTIMIDFETLKAWTVASGTYTGPIKEVKLNKFNGSIFSTLDYLKDLEYIDYDYCTGQAHVTHTGWNGTSATFKSAIQFTVRDIIVPLIVTITATVIIELL